MSQAAWTSTQGFERPLMNKIRELAYKVFARETAERVLDLVGFGYFVVPYKGPKQPGVSSWRDLQDVMLTEENLLKAWKRATVKGTRWYGVLLGRPSQHLVLVDIDSVTAEKLLEEGKEDEARRIVQDLYSTVQEIVQPVAEPALGLSVRPALFTHTRRGVHILLHLRPQDYSELKAALGKANTELGETKLGNHKVKVELRLRGATPLITEWHQTMYDILPLPPVSLQYLKRVLETIGVGLPEKEFQERSSAGKGKNWNRDVRNPIKNDEETHTPITSSKESSRETSLPPTTTGRLSEQNMSKIVDLLKNYWVPGHRNNLQLGLVGWLIKAGVPLEDAEKLFERLCDAAGDEEKSKRLAEVRRQYNLVQTGQKKLEELLGKAGLLAGLQAVIKEQNPSITEEEARDRALAVIHELEKILGPRRSILLQTPYESGLWIVNDPARGIVLVRERMDENGQVHRHSKYISDWYVRKVLIVKGDGQYLYKVLFKNARTKEKLVLSGHLDEIVKELRRLHGVKRSQHLSDAVSAVISEFIRRKLAKVKKTAAVAGILPVKTGVKLVRVGALSRLLVPKEPDLEKARQALQLLVELRGGYQAHSPPVYPCIL